jgi:cystathionine gamma-synthase
MDARRLRRHKRWMKFETLAVRAGGERDATGAITPPLHFSTNYEHGPAGEQLHDYLYIRIDNPTQRRLESALAAVEGGQAALVFASGVAAGAAYLQSLPAGSHVLFADDLFYGFRAMVPKFLPRWGIHWSEVDMTDLAAVRSAIRPETRLLWTETPSNPLMKVTDIGSLAQLARMAAHSANAGAVARALEAHSRVARVLYPGLPSHPGQAIAQKEMDDFGGMLSFRVKGGRARAIEVASRVHLFINAGSLGGPESLIQHAASVMHPADRIPDDLLRLSIGLEHPEDLVADLEQALG